MQVKGIPLPVDAESRGMDWPVAGEPTVAELAAIEAEMPWILAQAAALIDAADRPVAVRVLARAA